MNPARERLEEDIDRLERAFEETSQRGEDVAAVIAALRAAESRLGLCMAARNELQERINARDETIDALDAELVKHAEDAVDNRVTMSSPTEDT